MSTEAAEPDTGRRRSPDCDSRRSGSDGLPSVGRGADASRGVNGETDVADIGQCRAAAVDPDTDPKLEAVGQMTGPRPRAELALDRHGGFSGSPGALEDGEELISAG